MQKLHFDLDQIERHIREMYETADPTLFHPDQATAAMIKRSAGVQVALTQFIVNEIMAGTPSEVTFDALVCIHTTLIVNTVKHFQPNPGDQPMAPAEAFADALMDQLGHGYNRLEQQLSSGEDEATGIHIHAVMSGNA